MVVAALVVVLKDWEWQECWMFGCLERALRKSWVVTVDVVAKVVLIVVDVVVSRTGSGWLSECHKRAMESSWVFSNAAVGPERMEL